MLARKLACPSCSVRLKVAETLAAGTVIKCPKCGKGFPVPAVNGEAAAPKAAPAKPKKVAPPPPPEEEDLDEDEVEERPEPRKFRKKRKKKSGGGVLVWGLVIGAVVLVAGGGAAAFYFLGTSEKKEEPVAENTTRPPEMMSRRSRDDESAPSRREREADLEQPRMTTPQAAPTAPAMQPGTGFLTQALANLPRPAVGNPQMAAGAMPSGRSSVAAGRTVFEANRCTRCHAGSGAGEAGGDIRMGGQRSRGPDLAAVGRDPTHTVAWLMDHVRNPKSHRPDSRMPGYEGKINDADLRALGEYLASLK